MNSAIGKMILKKTELQGELAYRILKNYGRLESKWYKPDTIFTADQNGWAGDWEGRTILALVCAAQVTGREPAYLNKMLENLEVRLALKGYLGNTQSSKEIDEQQLSGHNWLLRGLLEYYSWKQDEKVLEQAGRLVKNLYLKTKGNYANYPLEDWIRGSEGKADGRIAGKSQGFILSTDIGCAFICLDGLSRYLEITGDKTVRELMEEMIAVFVLIDFKKTSMQTHATLTALRGILRFYRCTGEERYLNYAKDIFSQYEQNAMTENYANYNWFGRPYWTEPCAIVDAYMIAMELYRLLERPEYIDLAQRIYYNALSFAQRSNGGFGCDSCVGGERLFLTPSKESYEAYWCCTMRGAEGLKCVAEDCIKVSNETLYIIHPMDLRTEIEGLCIEERTTLPEEGTLKLRISGSSRIKEVAIYIPSFGEAGLYCLVDKKIYEKKCEDSFLYIPYGQEKIEIEITYHVGFHTEPLLHPEGRAEYRKFMHGNLLLGMQTLEEQQINIAKLEYLGNACYGYQKAVVLQPVGGMIDLENEEECRAVHMQILFAKEM